MTAFESIDLVIFEIAGLRFGCDLGQVTRIDFDNKAPSVGTPLGMPASGRRSLVFRANTDSGEACLRIDSVLGVKRVPGDTLRRMPAAAHAPQSTLGAWLDGDVPVLLIDLWALAPAVDSIAVQAPNDTSP